MKIEELNHVALHVSDVERSSKFYGEVIGLPALPRPAFDFPGAWFKIGACQELHLIGERLSGPVDDDSRGGHFAMRVLDIKAAEERLRKGGVPFRGPVRRPDGAKQIFAEDPDGHIVEFCYTGSIGA